MTRFGSIVLLVSLSFSIIKCARFRIEELSPTILYSIPILSPEKSNTEDAIQAKLSGRFVSNIPSEVYTDGEKLFVPDASSRMIRVFTRNTTAPSSIIADQGVQANNAVHVKLGIPGRIAATEDRIFIQSRDSSNAPKKDDASADLPPEELPAGYLKKENEIDTPSTILVLNSDFEPVGRLGVDGSKEPFPSILRMDADENGNLFVLYKKGGSVILSHFKNQTFLGSINDTLFLDTVGAEDQRSFKIEVEDIVPISGEEGAMACLVFRNRTTFAPAKRRILRHMNGITEVVFESDDPSDFFAGSRPDGGFYLTNVDEGSQILFKIYGQSGEYLNNRLVILPSLRGSWREIRLSLDDRIFSTRLYLGKLELYEWK